MHSAQSVRVLLDMGIEPELLARLTGPAMSADAWKTALTEHGEFVRHARLDGTNRWQVLDVSGIPLAIWEGAANDQGKQLNLNLGNLTGLTLDSANLEAAGMPGVLAEKVSFRKANLRVALLADARLDGADFTDARLDKADFSRASLRGASFRNAVVTDTDFENCDLRDADFTGASFETPSFKGAKLEGAKGLPPQSIWRG